MNQFPDSIKNLLDQLTQLPGLGPKSAERIIFYLLKQDDHFVHELTESLTTLKSSVTTCRQCYNISSQKICPICSDSRRDKTIVCVVALPPDVIAIEKTNDFQGIYHVLGGVLNPVENVTPEKLKIKELENRIKNNPSIKEVILATNPDLEGESTAMYLARHLKPLKVKITRLAKGLPMGSDLEYADEITISSALKGRQTI